MNDFDGLDKHIRDIFLGNIKDAERKRMSGNSQYTNEMYLCNNYKEAIARVVNGLYLMSIMLKLSDEIGLKQAGIDRLKKEYEHLSDMFDYILGLDLDEFLEVLDRTPIALSVED